MANNGGEISRLQLVIGGIVALVALCTPILGLIIQVNAISERQQFVMKTLEEVRTRDNDFERRFDAHTVILTKLCTKEPETCK